MGDDRSFGYDAIAESFISVRSNSGADIVAQWANYLPSGASVLDIGCGHGYPLTMELVKAGLSVYAIDASPKMVAAFAGNFPDSPVACESVLDSPFFDQKFDAIIMVGVIFLMPPEDQKYALKRTAAALKPSGHFLFSAPQPKCEWEDKLTGRKSYSLGEAEYRSLLKDAGIDTIQTHKDEGGSFYMEGRRSD